MLVSSKDGRRYTLAGDYDNIRENLGRTVTVWALPGSGTTSDSGSSGTASSTSQNSAGSSASAMGSHAGNAKSGMGNSSTETAPMAVTVRSIQLLSETCDRPIR